jgi:hypothetical protein
MKWPLFRTNRGIAIVCIVLYKWTICFIDSEQYFAYGTWYDRDTNHASVQFLLWFGVASPLCVRSACALVGFVLYSILFRHRFVIIRLLSSKIHIRYSYENFNSFFSVIADKLVIGIDKNDLFRIIRGTLVQYCTVPVHVLHQLLILRHHLHTQRPGT